MVVRMIRWPWPPIASKKFAVRLVVRGVEGAAPALLAVEDEGRMIAEVRWKGPKTKALSALRRAVKRNCTKVETLRGDTGEVLWNEEFKTVVGLTAHKENAFNPWEIEFVVFYGLKRLSKKKASILAAASINLAEYASATGEELELKLPLSKRIAEADSHPILHLNLKLLEMRTCLESSEAISRPPMPVPSIPSVGDPPVKDDRSALRTGLRKVKILTELVSTRKLKKTDREDEASDGRCSNGSEDTNCTYPFDTDSLDDISGEEFENGNVEISIRKSFSYGTLATTNHVDGTLHHDPRFNGEYEDRVYYSHRRSDVGGSHADDSTPHVPEQYVLQATKISILPWNKRKYGLRSSKAKGEPLLKKTYGEEGGDDIDYDRRQLSSSDESILGQGDEGSASQSMASDFGDDNFAVGKWEWREVISRDGQMKLSTEVFFASIDQRNERASGQSACTPLVAVIADWFKANPNTMPIKSQFDNLIHEGSLEWRNLCKNQTYRVLFPDEHFDLETVLQAKIRPLAVAPDKSFVGFFHPDGCEGIPGFEFLHGAMSFDVIWDEIARDSSSDCLYIVSWNDHFFVLKVEPDAYYLIDTLGERLYEGCAQAYIIKFDENTTIHQISNPMEGSIGEKEGRQDPVCQGKEACKEYIKSFLAAIPIRELQADIKKGLMASTPLHHRLQIEFHYTETSKETDNFASFPSLPCWESTSQVSWLTDEPPGKEARAHASVVAVV
ncbi:hypothetical protein HPP92_018629 [Vanilla planifolia]|uniref:C2 NT-type domain-containing protein n=1 Tax=Vanilla planifolia TaxID=51239 RepID=A0A835UKZ3_VANPL|nr:hypothetical protein HPP92_018629 [Vanilla planifolia]